MARQGASRPKVVSSGRLTASGRGHIHKKKVAGRSLPPLEPAYSLYSTDSEDQVTTVHKGLDRCAALLNVILKAEQAESKSKAQGTKTSTFTSKAKSLTRKTETDKKQHGRKTNAVVHANKRPVPVQRTIVSASSYHGLNPAALAPVTKTKQIQQRSDPPALSQSPANNEVQTHTAFNCRLTTSTPALRPQRPASAHSEPCAQSSTSSLEVYHHVKPNVSAVHQQCLVTSQSPFHNGSGTPVITGPISDGPQVGSVGSCVSLASSTGSLSFPSASVPAVQVPVQAHVNQTEPDANGPLLMRSRTQEQICCESSEEENEEEQVDTTPVRDISKETCTDVSYKTSPERTARNVMTVRYLLGELKTLVASQDSEAVRLISEVEESISLLPVMVGSTNIQAEIALALQPLRSENVQLRRRLRILNQQLLARERAEQRSRPVDCNLEMVALQSLNLTLQTQLNESHGEIQNLQQENMRLQKALENKESDSQQLKEQSETENNHLRLQLSEALAEIQGCQIKLQEHEIEKTALTLSLQQRDAEISRLQEIIRSLQRNQIKLDVAKSSQQLDLPQLTSHLTKSVLELHENAQRETDTSDKLSSAVKTYLQTLEGTGQTSPPHRAHCRTHTLQPDLSCGFDAGKESFIPSESKLYSPKVREIHKPILEAIAENNAEKITSFAPLRETSMRQLEPHMKPLAQCDELMVTKRHDVDDRLALKYLGRAFEKLGVSDGLLDQETKYSGRNFPSDHHGVALQLNHKNTDLNDHPLRSQHAHRCLQMDVETGSTGRPSVMESTLSSCDVKSLVSDWSVKTYSTFNTQDEQNFRDGLAALDASIESLQRTLRANLNK